MGLVRHHKALDWVSFYTASDTGKTKGPHKANNVTASCNGPASLIWGKDNSHRNKIKTESHVSPVPLAFNQLLQRTRREKGRNAWCGYSTDLMLRVSHPRRVVSLAVATWVQLWCGLHRPAVNFSCPLPSSVAELASWCDGYCSKERRKIWTLYKILRILWK